MSRHTFCARTELLIKEKEFSKLRDELTTLRRARPWRKVEKEYKFDGSNGRPAPLADGAVFSNQIGL